MPTTPKHVRKDLREAVKHAVNKGIFDPGDVEDYLLANNWDHSLPTRQTIINVLAENKVRFISGYWSKVEE